MRNEVAEKVANSVLERYSFPVDVERVARDYNILIVPTDFDDSNVSGVLLYKGGQFFIGVNSKHSEERRKFTVAHELGHFLIHKKRFHMDTEIAEGEVMFRDGDSASGEIREEIEANVFAASLLMPKQIFIETWHQERSVDALARRFGVSRQAAQFRLKNLGVST